MGPAHAHARQAILKEREKVQTSIEPCNTYIHTNKANATPIGIAPHADLLKTFARGGHSLELRSEGSLLLR